MNAGLIITGILACLVALAATRSFSAKNAEFESFKRRFGKTYKSATEEKQRLKIFLNNLKTIHNHNNLHKEGKISFDLGINQFTDLSTAEFVEKYNGFQQPVKYKPKKIFKSSNVSVPDSIDWRDYGYVTRVKDQGQCGSSWTFSVTGSVEGQHFASTGNLVSLSEQNLKDCCCWDYGCEGCSDGGSIEFGFECIINHNGIDTEDSYPYEQREEICKNFFKEAAITDYVDIPSRNEDALKDAAGTVGPISVTIDATHASFQLYNSGVYYEPLCYQNILDHGVLVAGYGTEGGADYWLVKNSWGTSWGEQGYIKMSRNQNNNCGIATQASYPIV